MYQVKKILDVLLKVKIGLIDPFYIFRINHVNSIIITIQYADIKLLCLRGEGKGLGSYAARFGSW